MRPTNLKFRSPKETTPAAYYPVITNNGSKLNRSKGISFGRSPRFTSSKLESAKVGFRVGPSSYEHKSPFNHIKGGHIYKAYHRSSDIGNSGYCFYGNHIVYEPALTSKGRRHSTEGTPRNTIFRLNSSQKHSMSMDDHTRVNKIALRARSPRNRPINPNIFE